MIFVDVPKHRQFVCTKCGSRNVKVMPIFPAARGMPGYAAAGEHRLAVEDCAIDRRARRIADARESGGIS